MQHQIQFNVSFADLLTLLFHKKRCPRCGERLLRRTDQDATEPKWQWEGGWFGLRVWYGDRVKLSLWYLCEHCRVSYSLTQLRLGIPGGPVPADGDAESTGNGGSPVSGFGAKEWNRRAKYCCGIGVLLMLVGATFAVYRWNYLRHAITTRATVTNLIESASKGGEKLFAPVYVFTDQRGESVEVTSFTASSSPPNIGDKIEVLYDPDNPKNSIERGFFSVWGVAAICGAIGAAFFIAFGAFAFLTASEQGTAFKSRGPS
jgi:Protein of unknown function (DUF3592)